MAFAFWHALYAYGLCHIRENIWDVDGISYLLSAVTRLQWLRCTFWKLRLQRKLCDMRFKTHPRLTCCSFFVLKYMYLCICNIRTKATPKDVASNGKVFNFYCAVQLIEIFVCEIYDFRCWNTNLYQEFFVCRIYQVRSLRKELWTNLWTFSCAKVSLHKL